MTTAVDSESRQSPLDDREIALWRGFLAWSDGITDTVAAAVSDSSGLSRPEYEVLRRIVDAGSPVEQNGLQRSLEWSASRLSHQLRRMVARGLIKRESDGPGRVVRVAISPLGTSLIEQAIPALSASVRSSLIAALPPGRGFEEFFIRFWGERLAQAARLAEA